MNILMLGVSGIGMQGLAAVASSLGNKVFGFDDFVFLESLGDFDIEYVDHFPDNIDLVVYSNAIKPDHFMRLEAQKRSIAQIHRVDFKINFCDLNEQIVVAGAHGKTTVSAMLAHILNYQSYFIGGIINGTKIPAHHQKSAYTVIESDESDGSFLWFNDAKYRILINIDLEHMDFFKTSENVFKAYNEFIEQTPNSGVCVVNRDCRFFKEIKSSNFRTYGKENADFVFHDVKILHNGSRFKINGKEFFLPLLGIHNIYNFTGIYALLSDCSDVDLSRIESFCGVKRRMQLVGDGLYSDYGHHPIEIRATLDAFFEHKGYKPVAIIEPHKYSRLNFCWDLWPEALAGFEVAILPVFAAGESPALGRDYLDFINFLRNHDINAYPIDFHQIKDFNNAICFSAGKAGSMISYF
jgi:UDP-N-acetylmuramate--alanine ligase